MQSPKHIMRKNALIQTIILLVFSVSSLAQIRKYSNEFLNIGAGARGFGMGGAQVASTNDATAGYWNPAGLVGVKDKPNATLMHADYFAGIANYEYASFAVPVKGNKRTLGISLLRFAVDDIPNTLFLLEPDGSINYTNIQTFSTADYAMLLSFAENLKDRGEVTMSYGINAKVIHRSVGKFAAAWGFGIDAGLQMHGEKWDAGVVLRDLTTTFNAWSFKFSNREKEILFLTKNTIPIKSTELTAPRLSIGGAYNFEIGNSLKLKTELNADFTFDGKRNTALSDNITSVDPRFGLEANIKDVFFVRGGVANFQKTFSDGDTLNKKKVWVYQPSIGAGFKIKNLMIDYAFTNLANQSNPLYTHIFSIKFNIVKKGLD
jgi:hypothetical protein